MIPRNFPFLNKVLSFLVTLSFIVMILVVMLQVLARYALPWSPNWTEEVARFSFIYMVSLAAGLAIRDREYVSVDTLFEYLSPKVKKYLEVSILLFISLFMFVMFYFSIPLAKIVQIQKSPALGVNMAFMYSAMSLMGLFTGFYAALQLMQRLKQP